MIRLTCAAGLSPSLTISIHGLLRRHPHPQAPHARAQRIVSKCLPYSGAKALYTLRLLTSLLHPFLSSSLHPLSDHSERAWFWLFPSDDEEGNQRDRDDPLGAPHEQRMYLDKDESIRFMVEDDAFDEGLPIPGLAATGGPAGGGGTGIGTGVTVEVMEAAKAKRKAPFRITVSRRSPLRSPH